MRAQNHTEISAQQGSPRKTKEKINALCRRGLHRSSPCRRSEGKGTYEDGQGSRGPWEYRREEVSQTLEMGEGERGPVLRRRRRTLRRSKKLVQGKIDHSFAAYRRLQLRRGTHGGRFQRTTFDDLDRGEERGGRRQGKISPVLVRSPYDAYMTKCWPLSRDRKEETDLLG